MSAEAVRRLEAAGYVNVGKTNLHEFAYGVTSQNVHYGTVPNPAAPGRTSGGSSGGSAAALAAGLADAALGTDSGGSIRIPAACCGIAGFKPSFGLVPMDGVFPLAPSFDHAGPMARDVAGCVEMMRALVPGLAAAPAALGELASVSPGVSTPIRSSGCASRPQRLAGRGPSRSPSPSRPGPRFFMREVADVHRELYEEQGELYGENVSIKIERCLAVTDAEAAEAAGAAPRYEQQALAALEGLDLLVTPTLAFVAPPADLDELAVRERFVRFTYPFNLLGWPALALPCGARGGRIARVGAAGRQARAPTSSCSRPASLSKPRSAR